MAKDSPALAYEIQRERLLSDRKKIRHSIKKSQENLEKLSRSTNPRKEMKAQYEKNKLVIFKNRLAILDGKLKYLRPSDEADIAYRVRQSKEFADNVMHRIPDELPLRFHGCPIFAAEQIIARGEIVSLEDRLGIDSIEGEVGQIYITTKENLPITSKEYVDLTTNFSLPAGCLFIVTPQNREDEAYASRLQMNNVRFRNDPDRLVAVISSPENVPRLQVWLSQTGISPDKAMDFDGFVRNIDRVISSVNIPYLSAQKSIQKTAEPLRRPGLDSIIGDALKRVEHSSPSRSTPSRDFTH